MDKNKKNILLILLVAIFFIVGFIGFKDSLPDNKNERVYGIVQEYLPHTIEKRTGGLAIVYKDGREKEKQKNSQIFHITDKLDKEWGKANLKIYGKIFVGRDRCV